MRTLLYIVLGFMVYAVLFYLQTYQPDLMKQVMIQVDVFGITPAAAQEQERLEKIKNLTIPYEEKQVLINHTVFMGANTAMVKLALGEPPKVVEKPWEEKKVMLIYYIYFMAGDKRPTVLVFQDDLLVNAYKGSAVDVGN